MEVDPRAVLQGPRRRQQAQENIHPLGGLKQIGGGQHHSPHQLARLHARQVERGTLAGQSARGRTVVRYR